MAFKLAWRNIISKPLRSMVTILAIALAVAMIFCMLSFKGAVYDFIFATETSNAGRSDILITYTSSGDTMMTPDALKPLLDGGEISRISPVLSLFATMNERTVDGKKVKGEYVSIRGFDSDKYEVLQDINAVDGKLDDMQNNTDNLIISRRAAEHFGLFVGSSIKLTLGQKSVQFIVQVIAENDGYFLEDSPYVFMGDVRRVKELVGSVFYNEIYIKAADGVNVDALIGKIASIDEYKNMKVGYSKDSAYIEEQTVGLTAPIVLAGAVIVAIVLACIILLFKMSEKDKINYMSQLAVVGATRKQIFAVFMIESVILALIGAVIGIAVASGVFVGLLKFTLSSTATLSVSPLFLFASAALGAVVAVLASLVPLTKAFGSTLRENQLQIKPKKKHIDTIVAVCLILLTAVGVILEFSVPSLKGYMSIVNIVLAFVTLAVSVSVVLKGTGKVAAKVSNNPIVKVASVTMVREKRFSRSVVVLTIGMLASMLLFMAWSLTTSIFSSYTTDFKDMIFVSNVRSDVTADRFLEIDGVKSATPLIWRKGNLMLDDAEKTVNLFGSAVALDLLDFKYITPRAVIDLRLASDTHYIVLDVAMSELYGVGENDTVQFIVDGNKKDFIVAGIVQHKLFSGNYAIVSSGVLKAAFGLSVDTVLVVSNGNIRSVVGAIQEEFTKENYYVVEALEAFRWQWAQQSSVFNLIGLLAVIVTLFIFATNVATVIIGRSTATKERQTMLSAGMSKNSLFLTEQYEHALTALIAFSLSYAVSVLVTACLINALRLFGLYFTFMYEAWVVGVVGACIAVAYTLLPLVLNYKKGYTLKRK